MHTHARDASSIHCLSLSMSTLRFISWNVHGDGSREKRISNKLKDLQADVVLLQEINLSKTAADVLTTAQLPHVYSACYISRQRGVAILVSRRVNFTVNNTVIDPEGRFLIVNLSLQNMNLCIANIYGPNVDNPSFFHSFFTSLSDHSDNTLIIGGDFNMVSDSGVDRLSTSGSQRNWHSTNIVKQYMNDFGLCDTWRSHHPTLRD